LIAKGGYRHKITCDGQENNKIPAPRLSRHARAATNPADSAIRSWHLFSPSACCSMFQTAAWGRASYLQKTTTSWHSSARSKNRC
ncbi:MAG TPA: hypothetical protein VHX63_00005, partial [Acidobacteriaceae bacterium]|nr:hypothetical protein [Acidobacteriaceae bacterium]